MTLSKIRDRILAKRGKDNLSAEYVIVDYDTYMFLRSEMETLGPNLFFMGYSIITDNRVIDISIKPETVEQ